ncbi:hypothetical protein B0H19DRAFT_1123101 [Mycena capillaripes]|nr:hypothetical protein B0H19DRAFT_1123101 [Mycena capillaripes]
MLNHLLPNLHPRTVLVLWTWCARAECASTCIFLPAGHARHPGPPCPALGRRTHTAREGACACVFLSVPKFMRSPSPSPFFSSPYRLHSLRLLPLPADFRLRPLPRPCRPARLSPPPSTLPCAGVHTSIRAGRYSGRRQRTLRPATLHSSFLTCVRLLLHIYFHSVLLFFRPRLANTRPAHVDGGWERRAACVRLLLRIHLHSVLYVSAPAPSDVNGGQPPPLARRRRR